MVCAEDDETVEGETLVTDAAEATDDADVAGADADEESSEDAGLEEAT